MRWQHKHSGHLDLNHTKLNDVSQAGNRKRREQNWCTLHSQEWCAELCQKDETKVKVNESRSVFVFSIERSSRRESLTSNLSVPDRESVYLHSVYQTTWNPPAAQQKVYVCTGQWAVFVSALSEAAALCSVSLVRLGVISQLPSLARVARSKESMIEWGSSVDLRCWMWKQWRRASGWQRETGTGTNTGTVHSATETDPRRPENLEEELSLSPSLFPICPNMSKSDRLTDCMLLLASGPRGRHCERHGVVQNEKGIF